MAATTRRKGRAAIRIVDHQALEPASPPIEFVIFEDNGGAHHWRLVTDDGATLAQSASFASHDEAEQGARRVRSGAGSASLEH